MTYTPRFDADELVGLMSDAERLHHNDGGIVKKLYVLHELKNDLGTERYERYIPILDPMIDMLKSIAKERNVVFSVLLHQKKKTKSCCCVS
jgi:hypothetical protein